MTARPKPARFPRVGALALAGALLGLTRCSQGSYAPFDGAAWPTARTAVTFPEGPAAIITNNLGDTISVVDITRDREVSVTPVGLDPIGIDGPHHLVLSPSRRVTYVPLAYPPPVVSPGPHGNHGSSTLPGVLLELALDDFRVLRQVPTDLNPGDLALTPDERLVLVSHFDLIRAQVPGAELDARRSTVRIYDADTLVERGAPRVCIAPHGIAVSLDSRRAYLACYGEDALAVLSLDDPRWPVERIPVGPGASSEGTPRYGPYALALSPDGRHVWVGNIEGSRATGLGRDVRVFSTEDIHAAPRAIYLDAAVMFPAFSHDGRTAYVPTQSPDGLVAIDTQSYRMRTRRTFAVAECKQPHQVAVSHDDQVFLLCEGQHSVLPFVPGTLLRLDPATLETRGVTVLGAYPDAVIFTNGAPHDGGVR